MALLTDKWPCVCFGVRIKRITAIFRDSSKNLKILGVPFLSLFFNMALILKKLPLIGFVYIGLIRSGLRNDGLKISRLIIRVALSQAEYIGFILIS